jgi:hypothetical protein
LILVAIPFIIQIAVFSILGLSPAHAAAKSKGKAVTTKPKGPSFFRKLIEGTSAPGAVNWRAGDSRSDYSGIITLFQKLFVLTICPLPLWFYVKYKQHMQRERLRKEVNRLREYKEVS